MHSGQLPNRPVLQNLLPADQPIGSYHIIIWLGKLFFFFITVSEREGSSRPQPAASSSGHVITCKIKNAY